jgi:hypothetical protein
MTEMGKCYWGGMCSTLLSPVEWHNSVMTVETAPINIVVLTNYSLKLHVPQICLICLLLFTFNGTM